MHKGINPTLLISGFFIAVLIGVIVYFLYRPVASKNIQATPTPTLAKAFSEHDSVIKWDFRLIDKALSCHFSYNAQYPPNLETFDKRCFAKGSAPTNPNTDNSYDYITTNDGKGYVIKARLSTGETYTLTETIHPTPLPK